MTPQEKQAKLQTLYDSSSRCNDCPYNYLTEAHKVFGSGNSNASLVLIGEAPGKDEEIAKKPFVGRSGKLLTQCIEKAQFSREDIFITNIVKCRPPNNRTPTTQEIAQGKTLLLEELAIIQPKVVCTLGASSARAFLNKIPTMAELRKTETEYNGFVLLHTYHPAYILRNRRAMDDFIQDLAQAFKRATQPNPR